MNYKLFLLLALLPCLTQAFNPFKSIMAWTNDCLKAKFASRTDCAILYDDDGCEGWAEPISTGYRELGWMRRNDAESVVVKQGCTFVGYQHAADSVSRRGAAITVSARGKSANEYMDFKGSSQLESRISAVDCSC